MHGRQASENRSCRKSRLVGRGGAAGLWGFRNRGVGNGAFARAASMLTAGFERPFPPPHGLGGCVASRREPYPALHRAICGKRLRGRR